MNIPQPEKFWLVEVVELIVTVRTIVPCSSTVFVSFERACPITVSL